MAINPESTPTVPTETSVDTKNIPTSVPVGPDGMTDYIRQPKAEIQGESKNFLAKLRAEVDKLIHPEQKVTSTPYAGEPVNAPNEVGVSANYPSKIVLPYNDVKVWDIITDSYGRSQLVSVPEGKFDDSKFRKPTVSSTPDAGAPVNAPNEVGVNTNTTISATVNPGNTIEPNPSGNVTSPGAVPTVPGF